MDHLLVHQLDLLQPTATTDRYNDTVYTWPEVATDSVDGWLSQRSASEVIDNRNAEIGEWVAFIRPGPEVDTTWRVRWHDDSLDRDRTFEVVGPPTPAHTPRGPHHLELPLREVRG